MKRILATTASDFGQPSTPNEIKQAILASEGRTIIAEIAAETAPLYPEVTSGEMVAAFGADLILLKGFNVETRKIAGISDASNPVAKLRELAGIGVGVNLEITDEGDVDKRFTAESLAKALKAEPDFFALTGYQKPEVTPERVLADIKTTRETYQGFLVVHPVLAHGSQLNVDDLVSYVKAGADMIILPMPGTVPGVTECALAKAISAVRSAGAIVSTTAATSQEGTEESVIQQIALSAKRAGTDAFSLGDAGVAGMAIPETIFALSKAVRGKRHTYVRMARSARR